MGRTQRRRLQRHRTLLKLSETKIQTADYLPPLYKYLSSLGWRNESQLTVRNFPTTGRGLCSKQAVHANDTVIKLPLSTLLTIATLEADVKFKNLFDAAKFSKDERIPFQSLMAFYLLYHRNLSTMSTLAPYLNSMPCTFLTPYFCAINELYCLPENILEKTVAQNHKIRNSFKSLQRVSNNQQHFDTIFNMDDFKWAYFAVNSRCVYVNSSQVRPVNGFFQTLLSDETNLALAPFLDLFNHSDNVSTTVNLLPKAKHDLEFVLTLQRAPTPIAAYSQLFISYGALANLKLITDYGFFLPHNQHDFFEISLLDIEHFIKDEKTFSELSIHRNKFKFIRDHNLDDQMFVHLHDGVSHNLRVVLYLLFKESSHFPNILNQVAFGAAEELDDIVEESRLLVQFKISEYRRFISDLNKLTNLSQSGATMMQYMEECVRYLLEFLESY